MWKVVLSMNIVLLLEKILSNVLLLITTQACARRVSSCLPACLVSVVRPPFDFYICATVNVVRGPFLAAHPAP